MGRSVSGKPIVSKTITKGSIPLRPEQGYNMDKERYHLEQEKCKDFSPNGKGFCQYGKFSLIGCRCMLIRPLSCPYAWKILYKDTIK